MTDKELAEEYCNNEEPFDTTESGEKLYTENDLKYAYLAGLKAGKPQWHDLRKNLNDLPTKENVTIRCVLNNGNEVICETGWYSPTEDEIGYGKIIIQFYCNDDCIDINDVIAWCELPKFEE